MGMAYPSRQPRHVRAAAPAVSTAQRFAAWRRLAEAARAHGRSAIGAVHMGHLAREARRAAFPIEGQSAALAARGLLNFVDAFEAAAMPERREALRAVLGPAADCVEAMLEEPALAAAALHRMRHGLKD